MSHIVEKMPHLAMMKNPSKISDPDSETDEFQNLISFSLSVNTSVVKFP